MTTAPNGFPVTGASHRLAASASLRPTDYTTILLTGGTELRFSASFMQTSFSIRE